MNTQQRHTVGVVSVGVPWFDIETANAHLRQTRALVGERYHVAGPETAVTDTAALDGVIETLRREGIDALLLQVATFPDGEAPARIARALHAPVILHSLPEPRLEREISLNSLCGANMIAFTLTALERPYTFVHGDPAGDARPALLAHLNAATALASLERTRVGLIGFRAPGFYPCAFDELLLRRRLGVAVDHVGLNVLSRALEEGARRPAPADRFPLIGGEGELPAEAVARMERFYGALTEVVEAGGHSVVAIKDWPEFFDANVQGGFWPALGWIQEEDGVALAPEGDVNGAVTMALERYLSGDQPALVDVSAWDDDRSTLTLWHYGCSAGLARDRDAVRYGEEGREVAFTFRPGRATLARVGLHRGELRLLTVAVEMEDEPVTLRRAAGYARTLRRPANEVVRRLLEDGWEHHPCLVYGDLEEAFAAVARLAGIPHTAL